MVSLQNVVLAIVVLVLSGAYALSATGGTYVFPGGAKATLTVTSAKPTMGEYETQWSDGTGSSGTTTATPSGTKPGDVGTAPAQTTSGKNGQGEPVEGGTYRVHKGKAQQKDSKGNWKTGKLLPEKKKDDDQSGGGTTEGAAGGAGSTGTLPANQGTGDPPQRIASRGRAAPVSKK